MPGQFRGAFDLGPERVVLLRGVRAEVIEDGRIRKEPRYLTDLWTEHGVRFIEQHKDQPFFLFLSYNGPYALGKLLLEPARNRHAEFYADQLLPSFTRQEMHPWQFDNKAYLNNIVSIRRVAAEVSGVDDGVGEILATLEKHGLAQNTLVIFTTDHGMPFPGAKATLFDRGLGVMLILRGPDPFNGGRVIDALVSHIDIYPTVCEHLGIERPPFLQGVSLTGAHRQIPRRTLVFAAGWRGTPFRQQYEKLRHDPQWETHELTTGHDVMREAPDDVVALLTS